MVQQRTFTTDRTCPRCRKANAVIAETIAEEQQKEPIESGPGSITFRYTITLYVNVSCKRCGFLGSTTLSKSHEGEEIGGSAQSQSAPPIDPDSAIGIIVDRLKNPKHRWTAPW